MKSKQPGRPKAADEMPATVAELLAQADVEAADRLQEIGAGSDADAKAARRALYLLKQKGVEPSATLASPTANRTAAPPSAQIKGFLTNVSGNASQIVYFEETDPYGGASMYHFILTNFASGLGEIVARRVPRRELGGMLDRLKRGESGLIVEAPADYARHLVRLAADKLTEAGGRLPQGYADAMRRIGPAETSYSRPLVYDLLDENDLANDMSFSREPEEFFKSVHFRSWFLAMEAVVEWEEKYFAAVQSRFAVDQAQRDTLGDKVIEEAADALLDSAALASLRRALEEQAAVLQMAGQMTEAKQALYHAVSIDPDQPAHTNPLLLFYVKRSIFVVMAYKAEMEPEQDAEAAETTDLGEAAEPVSLIERV